MKISHCFILLLIFFSGTGLLYGAENEKTASWYWQRGLEIARIHDPDSAFRYLEYSLSKGLPDDSLYYLWAEIYLYKGTPDTALALNLSTKPAPGSGFEKLVIDQRYIIYSMLGWEKEAAALLDSTVKKQPRGIIRQLIPECSIYLSGGGYSEQSVVERGYPCPGVDDSFATFKNGTGYATIRTGWNIPAGKTQKIQIGARFRHSGSRFSSVIKNGNFNDSANTSIGAFTRYSLLSNRLAVSYMLSRKNNYLDERSFVHSASASHSFALADFMGVIEGGYQFESPVNEHYYYIMSWWDKALGKKHDISWDLYVSGYSAEMAALRRDVPFAYFRNSMLYSDSACKQPFPQTLDASITADEMMDSLFGSLCKMSVPVGYWSVNPHFRYEYQINRRFSTGLDGGYIFTLYTDPYKWTDFGYGPEENELLIYGRYVSFLAYNSSDGLYYPVHSAVTRLGRYSLYENPVTFHSERRIDQALSLDLFLRTSFGKFGEIIFNLAGRRTFSTLMDSAPVDIEKWYGEVTLSYFFRFRPGKG